MKIALVSLTGELGSLSIQSLSSYLKKNGHEPVMFFVLDPPNKNNLEDMSKVLKVLDISLVGINLGTADFINAIKITESIKSGMSGASRTVIWGGPHPTISPEQSLKFADIVCLGEGEEALLELMNRMEAGHKTKGIKNMWFRDRRNDVRGLEENLDRYPFPNYGFEGHYAIIGDSCRRIDKRIIDKYGQDDVYCILTSRGCPYSCTYCYNNYRKKLYQDKGRYVRFRSPENVIAELKEAKKKFPKLRLIKFWDDLFLAHPQIDMLAGLYKKEIGISFDCMSTPVYITKEKILMLKDAGLHSIHIGIQSGSERVNKEIYRRQVPNNLLLEKVKLLNRLGIATRYDIIFNNPYETREDILETINLLTCFPKPFSIQGFSLAFFPGTEIYEMAIRDGLIELTGDKTSTEKDFFKYIHQENTENPIYKNRFSSTHKTYLNKITMLTPFLSRKKIEYLTRNENSLTRVYASAIYHKNYVWRLGLSRFLGRHKKIKNIGKKILGRE